MQIGSTRLWQAWSVRCTTVRMKQRYLYVKHVEKSTDTYLGYLYAELKLKIHRAANANSSTDSSENKMISLSRVDKF
jgi:hypothetical protein